MTSRELEAPPILDVQDVSRRFGALSALARVSLRVHAGEIFSVIGPNGAGKSTLFNVIAGLHAPTAGRVVFQGRDIAGLAPEAINRLGLAKTFQITNLFPEISVAENVRVAAQSRAPESGRIASLWRAPDVERPVTDLLAAFGLEGRRDELAENLSHGEQRYLEICLALATAPRLLLLDEPTAGMTPGETKEATALIRRIVGERGLTLLLIEHDMSVVMGISDRVAVLHFGEKIAEGSPAEVRSDPRSSTPTWAGRRTEGVFRIEDLHAGYGATPILFGVSLEVREGEAVALLGQNGMGKTTLMKTAMGFLRAWRGRIEFEGRNLTGLTPHEIARLGVGLVPENRRIFPGLSVRENLELGLSAVPRRTAALRRERLDEVFRHFPRLAERIDQPGKTLSGGEQQMLAIGRVMMAGRA